MDGVDELFVEHSIGSVRSRGTRYEPVTTMHVEGVEPSVDGGTSNRVYHSRLRHRPLKCEAHNFLPVSH